jgi:hypothetical protein
MASSLSYPATRCARSSEATREEQRRISEMMKAMARAFAPSVLDLSHTVVATASSLDMVASMLLISLAVNRMVFLVCGVKPFPTP